MYRAVVFDLGGVVLRSPLREIDRWEAEHGLPAGITAEVVLSGGPAGPWQRLERGELDLAAFVPAFAAAFADRGFEVDVGELMDRIHGTAEPRPEMLDAVDAIRRRGLATAALTNNWPTPDGAFVAAELRRRFDVVVESWREGVRKPDPEIYLRTLHRLGVPAEAVVFLDDIGANLKTARALGMRTIKVDDPAAALADLAGALGFDPRRRGQARPR